MLKLIGEEQEELKQNMNLKARRVDKKAVVKFTQIKPGIFVFCNNFHFSMSQISITCWQRCDVEVTWQTRPLKPCKIGCHKQHDGLLPFFRQSGPHIEPADRKQEVAIYRSTLSDAVKNNNYMKTCYHCNGLAEPPHGI